MNELVVPIPDQYVGLARHGGVHGVAGEALAEQAVGSIGRHAANVVAGVEELDLHVDFGLLEVLLDLALEELADVAELAIPRLVPSFDVLR